MAHRLNSLLAYQESRMKFSKREKEIYGALVMSDKPLTDRELRDKHFPGHEMNYVRPRISDLIKDGWIEEMGQKTDIVTNKRVRLICALSPEERYRRECQPQQELDLAV